jgi:hypothetical protein
MLSIEHERVVQSAPEERSIKELIVMALDDVRELLRAQLELANADATQILKTTALALVVITATAVLSALAISLLLAALVLSLHGTHVQALLAAAAGTVLICASALAWLWAQLHKTKPAPDRSGSEAELLGNSARAGQPS